MAKKESTISQADAVRDALANGADKPSDGVEYIKTKYGLDIAPGVFSSYKSHEKKRSAGASTTVKVTGGGSTVRGGKTAEGIAVVEQVKTLVDQHGHATIARCLELFAK